MHINKLCISLLLLTACNKPVALLQKNQDQPIATQEIREELADLRHLLHNIQIEMQLLEDQIKTSSSTPERPSQELLNRISRMEKQIQQFSSTLSEYGQQITETQTALSSQKKLLHELNHIKSSIASLTTSLQKSEPAYHKVKAGESLEKIAKQYKVSVADLKKTNNLTQDTIRIGQELVVPSGIDP